MSVERELDTDSPVSHGTCNYLALEQAGSTPHKSYYTLSRVMLQDWRHRTSPNTELLASVAPLGDVKFAALPKFIPLGTDCTIVGDLSGLSRSNVSPYPIVVPFNGDETPPVLPDAILNNPAALLAHHLVHWKEIRRTWIEYRKSYLNIFEPLSGDMDHLLTFANDMLTMNG